jgi:hypothetical protein
MSQPTSQKQLLHLVFGGELNRLGSTEFEDINSLGIAGVDPNRATVRAGWDARAQRSVDNAQMRRFIVHLHRLLNAESTGARPAR